ncbi:MAG TPA: hypothetical protein PLI07_04560, partial [Candidatus Hydrogenedentes bacterium]|nr:hypothetical protein [Candidatus Hydrogenedentota bacterium]
VSASRFGNRRYIPRPSRLQERGTLKRYDRGGKWKGDFLNLVKVFHVVDLETAQIVHLCLGRRSGMPCGAIAELLRINPTGPLTFWAMASRIGFWCAFLRLAGR